MSGLYRGFWWAYLGGIFVGAMMVGRDDWWFVVPVAVVTVLAVTRRVA